MRHSIRLMFVKKTSMPNHLESFGNINCYSSSSPRLIKSLSNSIRHICFKDFTNHRKETNRAVHLSVHLPFSCLPFPNILKHSEHWWELLTTCKLWFSQTHIEEYSQYVGKFTSSIFQNHHWNATRTKCLWQSMVTYDLFNKPWSYIK